MPSGLGKMCIRRDFQRRLSRRQIDFDRSATPRRDRAKIGSQE